MATWAIAPQRVFSDTHVAPVILNDVSAQTILTGRAQERVYRIFDIQLPMMTSATAQQCADFIQTMAGPWRSFEFLNPNDDLMYSVRLDASAVRMEWFDPQYFRIGGSLRFVALSLGVPAEQGGYGGGGYGGNGYGD